VTIQGIMFDFGWTLVDFVHDSHIATTRCIEELEDFFQGHGFDLNSRVIFGDYFKEVHVLWQAGDALHYEYSASLALLRALRRYVSQPDAARLTDDFMVHSFESVISSWQLYPDTLDTLAALRDAGYRLGCVSNTNDGHITWSALDRNGLRSWLEPIYLSVDVGLRKPHPRIFQMALDDWGLRPDQAIMVGDNLKTDVMGARNAGLRSVWIDQDTNHPWRRAEGSEASITPDATIRQLSELPGLLAGAWGHS